jgi:CBS domain containing-hemolysin-like protein
MSRHVLVDEIARGGYTRVPVYRESLDDIVGILHVVDLLKPLDGDGRVDAAALAREAITVPTTLAASEVLTSMRQRGVREALVIDEYGGTAGMVTFESLMEPIVGELATGGLARINVLADGSAEIDGLVLATEVNLQFGLHIDQDTFTTVGGFVLGQLGRRPRVGDVVTIEGRRLRVEALDGIRVARVRLSAPKPPPAASNERDTAS